MRESDPEKGVQARLRNLVSDRAISVAGIARAAGVPIKHLRNFDDEGWSLDAETRDKLTHYFDRRENGDAPATPEEIIEEARNGRMFILVDDEDRENEGDLVIPAQMATPDVVNFMATHGRGLICLAITSERNRTLQLPMMGKGNESFGTAFTVSIEAGTGVTTGISARDRALTIATAIDSTHGPEAIVSPGHVFPLVARDGGVLVRAGHTEAAVDVARLAGLNPSGVICEIMNDDGTMARMDDLRVFARRHGLKLGTIRDLIAFRLENDAMIEKRSEISFESKWGGTWAAITFFNRIDNTEQLVLQKGVIERDRPTLVRMHQLSPLADVFGAITRRSELVERSMKQIAEHGSGVVVLLVPREADALSNMFQTFAGERPRETVIRDYGIGAQILLRLGVGEVVSLTNHHYRLAALEGYGLDIVGEEPIAG